MGRGRDLTATFLAEVRRIDSDALPILRPVRKNDALIKEAAVLKRGVDEIKTELMETLGDEAYYYKLLQSRRMTFSNKIMKRIGTISKELSVFKAHVDEAVKNAPKHDSGAGIEGFGELDHPSQHYLGIFLYLQKHFQTTSRIFDNMELERGKQLASLETFRLKVDSKSKQALKDEQRKGKECEVIAAENTLINILQAESERKYRMELTEDEERELQQENELLQRSFQSEAGETRQIEQQLREVAQLHSVMSLKIEEQAGNIENIHQTAVNVQAAVSTGNENVAEASKRGWTLKLFLSYVIFFLTIFLLFLHCISY
tara:strand:- start:1298 stop:2245 length:948 start_codon:yes stop_codon:yes gene_type:complete